jgi:hypothetical protein
MSIENLFSRHCSFCSSTEHDIRLCSSPLINDIDRRLSEGFYAITQQGELLRTREEDIKERFIVWATDLFHLKDLRVFVVTTVGSPTSGYNKRQYAEEVWNVYKTLTSTIVEEENEEAVNEEAVNEEAVEDEITWSIDRTPRRHSDIEMMPLPSIRMSRSERVRERRARDVMNYIPSPEFVSFVRNLMEELDSEADFIPFSESQGNNKFNIALTKLEEEIEVCECAICLNNEINRSDIVTLNCEHQFCGDCIVGTLKTHKKSSEFEPRCALCRTNISEIKTNNADVQAKIQEYCLQSY